MILTISIVFFFLNLDMISAFFTKLIKISSPLIYGACFAYALNPLMKLYEEKVFRPRRKKAPLSRTAESLTRAECRSLASQLKRWPLPVTGTNGMKNAQVTLGGADTGHFDPATMESKKVPGLYVTGELYDIDGDCGGYNLQWAWSSGRLAGKSAADSLGR